MHLNFLHGRDEVNASINSLDEINEQLSEDHSTFAENETQASNPEVQPFKAPKHSMKRRPVVEDPRIAHALSIMDNVKKTWKIENKMMMRSLLQPSQQSLEKLEMSEPRFWYKGISTICCMMPLLALGNMVKLQQLRHILNLQWIYCKSKRSTHHHNLQARPELRLRHHR
nr:unnamed protein product [Callosobruchus analis]